MRDSKRPPQPAPPGKRPARVSWRLDIRLHRLLVVLAVVALPLGHLLMQALRDPGIKFLTPSWKAQWALHPVNLHLQYPGGHGQRDVAFVIDFRQETVPRHCELQVRAFDTMRVTLNGRVVLAVTNPALWKKMQRIDLAPHLRAGENRLRIRVRNAGAPPALLVAEPALLRTPGNWQAALEPQFTDLKPVVPPLEQHSKPGPLQQWAGWRWAKPLTVAWLIGVVALGAAAAILHVVRRERAPPRGWTVPRWARIVVPVVLLVGSLWMNGSNTAKYPFHRSSFDWEGHVEYIQRVARTWKPPVVSDGWMMYQPPLYYYASAAVYRLFGGDARPEWALKRVQYFGCATGFALTVLAWLYARWAFPKSPTAQWLALAFAAFLPMTLYMNPILTNEVAASSVIAGALYLLLRWAFADEIAFWKIALLALTAGLALLLKFSALFCFLVGAMVLSLRALNRSTWKNWTCVAVYLCIVLAVCGWYYLRNVRLFGNPFVGNWDAQYGLHYEMPPGYQTASTYVQFGSVFFHHPERARWTTWLDGNYASFWADGHHSFFELSNTHAYFWQGVMLFLAALPSMAILLGLGRTVVSAVRHPANNPDFLLWAVPALTWFALIQFTMEVPKMSTVKAFYFLSLVPCLGVFLARGRELFGLHLRPVRWLLDGVVVLLAALAVWIYRFTPG